MTVFPVIAWIFATMTIGQPELLERRCVPHWRDVVLSARTAAKRSGLRRFSVASCPLREDGIVNCDPRMMRAAVESKLHATGLYTRPLSLDAYSVARNIASEAGTDADPAEKIAIGEAAVNRARRDEMSIARLTLKDGRWYARQRGKNPRVASSRDPQLEDVIAADLVLDGRTGNFARGATHYFSPRGMDWLFREGRTDSDRWDVFERWTKSFGLAWVGELPGINPETQFLMKDADPGSAYWERQYAAGRTALSEPVAFVEPQSCPRFSWGFAGLASLVVGAALAAVIWQTDELPWDLT